MIASISGKINQIGDGWVVVETGGIGYKVNTTPNVLEMPVGSTVSLKTYLQVREDAMVLFGFLAAEELEFFEMLITVSGVGPKGALGIMSSQNMKLIKNAIANQDAALFTKIGGVGKKTAEKIILELRDKVFGGKVGGVSGGQKSDDLVAALENFGYSSREIKDVLGKLDQSAPTEERLRKALKILGR
jgi:Holliday junction DNA helicase RuvA